MGKSITPTVEGGLLVAITVILSMISIYIPVFGVLIQFFCAVPLAVLTARQGKGKGFLALTVTMILLMMLMGPVTALKITLVFNLSGVVLGWCLYEKYGAVRTFISTLMVSFAAEVLLLMLLFVLMDVNFIEMQKEMLRESFQESFQMYESMGVEQARIAEAQSQVEPLLKVIAILMPVLIFISSLVFVIFQWLATKMIFRKLQMSFPIFPPFAAWKFPVAFMYMAVVGGLGMYWGSTRGWVGIYEIAMNITLIALLVGLIQGFALLSYVFNRYNVSKFVRWLLYVLIILNMLFLQIVAVTGLVDMLFDYRKRLLKRGGD
ncbi:MAG: YybS family protein [Selenomonadaceae bacterium]|nr:YybS family protein [Selenomonadaceae bacterium]